MYYYRVGKNSFNKSYFSLVVGPLVEELFFAASLSEIKSKNIVLLKCIILCIRIWTITSSIYKILQKYFFCLYFCCVCSSEHSLWANGGHFC